MTRKWKAPLPKWEGDRLMNRSNPALAEVEILDRCGFLPQDVPLGDFEGFQALDERRRVKP